VTCTYCRTHKKRCSLKKKDDKPPCKYCKKHGIGCTFYDAIPLDTMKKSSKGKGKQKATNTPASAGPSRRRGNDEPGEVSVPDSEYFDPDDLMDLGFSDSRPRTREPTPEVEMEDAEGHAGLLTRITTSFAHPIKFHTDDSAPDCNFCEMPVFGFVGHFEKGVHVIKWHDGRGCTEIAAGHREEHDATVMCQNCTFARLQVLACPGHGMVRMEEGNREEQDFEAAAEKLMEAEPRSEMMLWQLQRWCSMCFSLASFRCCTAQPSITGQGTEEDEDQIEGCELRFCNRCEQAWREQFEGSFPDMVAVYDLEPKAQEDGEQEHDGHALARADVGFLKADGYLMRNVEELAV
jgi:hypothetical protein